jgi:CRP/FNR family transcriptional regulator, cyclic AMP receptor protein
MTGDAELLRAVPLFGHLDDTRLSSLLRRSSVRTVRAGAPVAVRGDAATRLLVVEAGALTAVRETADGRRLRLGEFPAPCTVDKAAVLAEGRHTATWLAAVRSRVRLVPAGELLVLIDEVPAVRRHVLAYLARRVHDGRDDLARATGDTTARVAAWLAEAAARPGARVVLPGAQAGLAETLGVSRVSVNRALRTLARAGLVRVEPGAVVVTAPETLRRRRGG